MPTGREDADQRLVEPVCSLDPLGEMRSQVGGNEQDGAVLPSAQAAMCADQALEGGDVSGVLVDAAVDVEEACSPKGSRGS
jgi:hypothetical protein